MAKSFKRVTHNIHYRHLGEEVYHAAFLIEIRPLHGRSSVYRVAMMEFAVPGMRWAPLFSPSMVVVSPHVVIHADSKVIAFEGKDAVRAEMLHRARRQVEEGQQPTGFSTLWSNTCRGTVTTIMHQLGLLSHRLEAVEVETALMRRQAQGGTRCPDCSEVVCTPECPGMVL